MLYELEREKGIPIITVDYTEEDFDSASVYECLSMIKNVLGDVKATMDNHSDKIQKLYNYYLGDQDIRGKTRNYKRDLSNNNNKIVENHCYAQVEFKKGLVCGENVRFTLKGNPLRKNQSDNVDENIQRDNEIINLLESYMDNVDYKSKKTESVEYIYSTGMATFFCLPKKEYDPESPFMLEVKKGCNDRVVYSSEFGNPPLFCVHKGKRYVNRSDKKTVEVYKIWTKKWQFLLDSKGDVISSGVNLFGMIPMVEIRINPSGLGITELNHDLFDAINLTISNEADALIDNINKLFVFLFHVEQKTVDEFISNGAISVPSEIAAKYEKPVYTIDNEFNFSDINTIYDRRIQRAYEIAGIPLNGTTVSSGITGSAQEIGGGWLTAYIRVKEEIRCILKGDYALLKIILQACNYYDDNWLLRDVKANDIEVKYNFGQNDNILTRTQSAKYLYDMNVPPEMIFAITGLSVDSVSDGAKWSEYEKQKANQNTNINTIQEEKNGSENNTR